MSQRSKGVVYVVLALTLAGVALETRVLDSREAERQSLQQKSAGLQGRIRSQRAEIDRLKGQIAIWSSRKSSAQETPNLPDPWRDAQITNWADQGKQLQKYFADHPEQAIAEMSLLSPLDWLWHAREAKLEDPVERRKALAKIRSDSRQRFSEVMGRAMSKYLEAHDDALPASTTELTPYLDPKIDPALLASYRMLISGKAADNAGFYLYADSRPAVDENYDSLVYPKVVEDRTMLNAALRDADITPEQRRQLTERTVLGADWLTWASAEFQVSRQEAQRAYMRANGGRRTAITAELLPYVTSLIHRAYLEATVAYANANGGRRPQSLESVLPFLATQETREFAEKLFGP